METSIVAGAQVALYLVFIGKVLQLTAGMEEPLGLRGHAVVAQQVAEDFEVARLIGAALILSDFLEVREGTPLPLLVGDDRSGVRQRVAIVARNAYLVEIVVIAVRCMHVPVEAACPTLHMVFRPIIPCPAATNAGSAIDLRGVVLVHCLHPVIAIRHPVASRLIASRHHHKRRMMAIGIDDAAGLLEKVFVDDLTATQLHAMIGPRRSFGLQVEAHLVGSGKGGFGRAVAVEAHMVEPILTTLLEDSEPRRLIGGRIARLGEAAVLYRATQPDGFAVQVELRSADADVAHAEAQRERPAVVADLPRVEIRVELVPELEGVAEVERVDGVAAHVDDDTACGNIGNDTDGRCRLARAQFDAPDDAVPVALRLVGHAVGILSDAHILDPVVDADADGVPAAEAHEGRDVVLVGCGERQLVTHLPAVDEDGGLDVGTLEEEHDGTFAP